MIWQYKLIEVPVNVEISKSLDDIGLDGWEMIGFKNISNNVVRMIFKRPQIAQNNPRNLGR